LSLCGYCYHTSQQRDCHNGNDLSTHLITLQNAVDPLCARASATPVALPAHSEPVRWVRIGGGKDVLVVRPPLARFDPAIRRQ
jgi:hypothetical protein